MRCAPEAPHPSASTRRSRRGASGRRAQWRVSECRRERPTRARKQSRRPSYRRWPTSHLLAPVRAVVDGAAPSWLPWQPCAPDAPHAPSAGLGPARPRPHLRPTIRLVDAVAQHVLGPAEAGRIHALVAVPAACPLYGGGWISNQASTKQTRRGMNAEPLGTETSGGGIPAGFRGAPNRATKPQRRLLLPRARSTPAPARSDVGWSRRRSAAPTGADVACPAGPRG